MEEFRLQHVEEFLDEEKYILLQLIWAPAFENSKFYLYDNFIMKFLTNDMSTGWLSNFLRRILENNYTRNVDYEIVEFEHPLVQSHIDFVHSLDRTVDRITKIGNKRYVIVSASCMKQLLMRSKKAESRYALDLVERINKFKTEFDHRKNMQLTLIQNTKDNEIIPFLQHFDGINLPTDIDMARIAKFDEREVRWLEYFWQPTFNESMIYLSDDFIKEHLTNDKSKDWLRNFLHRILEPNYEIRTDYDYVEFEHDLVQFFKNNIRSYGGTSDTITKINNKKYPIVTGECLKTLLMTANTQSGKEIRRIYIKIEKLVKIYRKCNDYIRNILTEELLTKRAIAAESNIKMVIIQNENYNRKRIDSEESSDFSNILAHIKLNMEKLVAVERLNEFHRNLIESNLRKTKGYIYIMSSDNYQERCLYKVGSTTNLDSRLKQYTEITGISRSIAQDEKYFVFTAETVGMELVEQMVKFELGKFKEDNGERTEMYHINYDILYEIVMNCLKIVNGISETMDEIVRLNYKEIYNKTYAAPVKSVTKHQFRIPEENEVVPILLQTEITLGRSRINWSEVSDPIGKITCARTAKEKSHPEVKAVAKTAVQSINNTGRENPMKLFIST